MHFSTAAQDTAVEQKDVTAIEIAKQIAAGNVKVTPDILVQGRDSVGGLLAAFLTSTIAGSTKLQPLPPPQAGPRAGPEKRSP